MVERSFLITQIPHHSKVVLYGAGQRGYRFVELNNEIGWCHIVAVVDNNYQKLHSFPVPVSAVEFVNELEYDYLLITLADIDLCREIKNFLINRGVSKDKIIERIDDCWMPEECCISTNVKDDHAPIVIAMFLNGGIGDYVVYLKLVQSIVKQIGTVMIDLWVNNEEYARSAFYGQDFVRNIYNKTYSKEEREKYTAVFTLKYFELFLKSVNFEAAKRNQRLYQFLQKQYEFQNTECIDVGYYNNDKMIRLCISTARFFGLNRYTFFARSGAFHIDLSSFDIKKDVSYLENYKSLGLRNQFITFNYGAAEVKNGLMQTKVWPFEYFCELNKLIKKWNFHIEIVQIGAKNCRKVPGADRYLLGCNLETVKYILENSMLHIDCEGGMTHLSSQLGTKCLVLFGPTPSDIYGYANNINMLPMVCGECMGATIDWASRCCKYSRPECMYSITPNIVFDKVKEYLIQEGGL